jgi:hypothetical protein
MPTIIINTPDDITVDGAASGAAVDFAVNNTQWASDVQRALQAYHSTLVARHASEMATKDAKILSDKTASDAALAAKQAKEDGLNELLLAHQRISDAAVTLARPVIEYFVSLSVSSQDETFKENVSSLVAILSEASKGPNERRLEAARAAKAQAEAEIAALTS